MTGVQTCALPISGKTSVGNPINVGTGNKFQREDDYIGVGHFPLSFARYYNSSTTAPTGTIGQKWLSTYDRRIDSVTSPGLVKVVRHDGRIYTFRPGNGGYVSDADVSERLVKTGSGWQYFNNKDETETYDNDGLLRAVTNRAGISHTLAYNGRQLSIVSDAYNRSLTFTYNSQGWLSTLTDPAGKVFSYAYQANGALASVTYPDQKTRQYVYEKPAFPYALTGIVDENNQRYATWTYDASGRAVTSEHGVAIDAVSLVYAPNTTTVIDTWGNQRTYTFIRQHGVSKNTGITGIVCDKCGPNFARTYDANGFVASRTDFKGNQTQYSFNARGLETSRTEAVGKAEARTTSTEWHPTFRLPTKITETGRVTDFIYDAAEGTLLNKTITDTPTGKKRTWAYTYNPNGQVLSANGPRTDVTDITKYEYDDATGNLKTITNALNHITRISEHDQHGRPLTIVDPNGLITKLEYDLRGRIITQKKSTETMGYEYDPAGMLSKLTRPDGSYVKYFYDIAHRLNEIHDTDNNKVVFDLDQMGNRKQEAVYNNNNQQTQILKREYNTLNRLTKTIGATQQTTAFDYDNNGNLTSITDPLAHTTLRQYDALNRLAKITDANQGNTDFTYTALDKLATVTDPRRLTTTYINDGLDNVSQTSSPDSGVQKDEFDAAGNRTKHTDAKGQITLYQYDALNRLTKTTRADGSVIGYAYDQGINGIGRLSAMADTSGSTAWGYNALSRVETKVQKTGFGKAEVTLITGYLYDSAGRLYSQSPASGSVIQYGYNANGRVNFVTINGVAAMSDIQYQAFGPIKSWKDRRNNLVTRSYDQDGRMTANPIGAVSYDDASRIAGAYGRTYAYDNLDRLTGDADAASRFGYAYDATGNRTSAIEGTAASLYSISGASNRLTMITASGKPLSQDYDTNGSLTSDGNLAMTYDAQGRLVELSLLPLNPLKPSRQLNINARYSYNGLGERVAKLKPQGDLVPPAPPPPPAPILYCDINGDRRINKNDLTALSQILSGKKPAVAAADCNRDGVINDDDLLDLQDLVGFTKPSKGKIPLRVSVEQALLVDEQPLPARIQIVDLVGIVVDATTILNSVKQLKAVADPDTIFTYSDNRLEGEYDANGKPVQEWFWLDAMPIAMVQKNQMIYTLDTDHLNTPRQLKDAGGKVVWNWNSANYGKLKPNEDPDGDGNPVTFNLRYPGQYYDAESGLHYNYFRDYNPATGRYQQSDPIGLQGGMNTYAYVNGNPISKTDPLGLFDTNVSGGVQVSGQFLVFGGSLGAGGVIGSNGQKCKYIQTCVRTGMGFYAGAGANISGTLGGGAEPGVSMSFGVGGDVGMGASAGAQITAGSGGISGGGGKFSPGLGWGASAGIDVCFTKTYDCSCF